MAAAFMLHLPPPMTLRSLGICGVLVAIAFATIATSAPEEILLSATASGTLGPGQTRLTLSINRTAVNDADSVIVEFRPDGITAPPVIYGAVDPAMPFELNQIASSAMELRYDLDGLCTRDRDCEAAITVSVPAGAAPGGALHALVTGSVARSAEAFPSDARIAVRFGP